MQGETGSRRPFPKRNISYQKFQNAAFSLSFITHVTPKKHAFSSAQSTKLGHGHVYVLAMTLFDYKYVFLLRSWTR